MIELQFRDGTLLLAGLPPDGGLLAGLVAWDERAQLHRAAAVRYAEIVRLLYRQGAPYRDAARAYRELQLGERAPRALRPYQQQALRAWEAARRRGVIVLPTGAGKSYVAVRAMLACQRSTLVVAPTIELVEQWARDLEQRFACRVGRYGGGERELAEITVATYDSAVLFMPWHGNRFGLVVFDECHHLPAEVTSQAAWQCLAPFRLGLTATPERRDGLEARLAELIGPIVHRTAIGELEGRYLADYQVELIEVAMDPEDAALYAAQRARYLAFVRRAGIELAAPDGWQRFLAAAARDPEGRAALQAWRVQQRLARANRAKLAAVWRLLRRHAGERVLIFTDDNDTAYAIGEALLLPVLTHRTRPPERRAMLDAFRSGRWPVLVTSRVLNEGVDVPEAAVGIVVSGSGSVREHVQRLGRILRPRAGKVAVLYELVSAGTAEYATSERRRAHAAFGAEGWRDEGPC
ncbi:MAG: DEAD/DEAH box helicase family protein [Planctomycetota bacterium]|nr:DEAD/DEAH box helicase family protein [Planctomycetota bacterium]MCX8005022.1 DEAD/DEAH box helicase family protein [Burkholderiaceae bacterium]MDW8372619.1 DEAD/DEAH box helicase family protein [Planctomycetota bacterium]